jgi:hypothetical protein
MNVNKVILLAGARGTGKTTLIKNEIVLPSPLPKKLIVDTFDNPVWKDMSTFDHPENEAIKVPVIPEESLEYWYKGLYRCYSSQPKELFKTLTNVLRNTLLVIEDATKAISNKEAPDSVMKFVYDSKQKNLNIVLCFHSLTDIPANLVRGADYITLLKTGEPEVPGKFKGVPGITEAFDYVKQSENRYENVTLQIN